MSRLNVDVQLKPFDCGDDDLNDFFWNDCKNFQKQLLGVTYIIENETDTIAFFTVLNDKISLQGLSGSQRKKVAESMPFPKRGIGSFPAVKLGRLGVNGKYQGQGFGKHIINYLLFFFVDNNRTGCKYITVDAYRKSIDFYKSLGFKEFGIDTGHGSTQLMYIPLIPIA